jgi:hypothetical protein
MQEPLMLETVGHFNEALLASSAHLASSLRKNAASFSGAPPT